MPRPRYQVMADELIAEISSGRLPIGSRLPPEMELCIQSGLSRGTVREALRRLEELGMIQRSRAGTTVAARQPLDAYHPSAGTPDEIMDLVRRTKLFHPTVAEVQVDDEQASRLDIPVGSRWHMLAGPLVLRSDTSTVLCWSEHYHLTSAQVDRFRGDDYDEAGVELTTLEQVITSQLLSAAVASALGTTAGAPALVVRRRHLDHNDDVLKVSIHTHRGDTFRITTTTPSSAALV